MTKLSAEAIRQAIADYDVVMRRGSVLMLQEELRAAHLERVQNQGSQSIGSDLYANDLAAGLAKLLRLDRDDLIGPVKQYLWPDDEVSVNRRTLHAHSERVRKTPDRRAS